MQHFKNITCPVCGRPNRVQDQCTFCGANLKEVAPPGPEGPAPGPLPSASTPASDGTESNGHAPSSHRPTRPWEGPALVPKFAGFWIRTVAYLIDGFLIHLLYAILLTVGVWGYATGSEADALSDFSYILFETDLRFLNLLSSILYVAYFTFFLGTRGQTPGKMICGLKVLRLDGSPVGIGQAAVRTFGYYLSFLTLCIGFLWVAFDPRKQGLHDKIAGTCEIRVGLAEIQDWHPSQTASSS